MSSKGQEINLAEGTGGGTVVGFKAPDTEVVEDVIWTLPDVDGEPGQALATDGFGNLEWVSPTLLFAYDLNGHTSTAEGLYYLDTPIGDNLSIEDNILGLRLLSGNTAIAIGQAAAEAIKSSQAMVSNLLLPLYPKVVSPGDIKTVDFLPPITGFTWWNTKADGTGITYYVGDTVIVGLTTVVLYAQVAVSAY